MSAIQHKPPVQDSSDSLSMLDIEFVFKNRWIRVTAAIGLTFILCLIFVIGAEQQGEEVNTDISASDQYAYIHYAQNLANSSWNYEGDGNRMPLYPSIMAVFFRADMTDDSFFELGKKIGIVIALVVIAEAFLIFRRVASLCDALAATLVSAFTVFAYKAPYFSGRCHVLWSRRATVCPIAFTHSKTRRRQSDRRRSCRWISPPYQGLSPTGCRSRCFLPASGSVF